MPFSKYDEIQTAKCELLEEIWPAILTKAILKLFKYKFSNRSYEEIGDLHIIYALTGYQGERILLKNPKSNGSFLLNSNNCSNRKKINLKCSQNDYSLKQEEIDRKKITSPRSSLNKYFDSDDTLNNKLTEEKFKVVIKNVLNIENYSVKKTFLLNFNTLNQYSNKKLLTVQEELLSKDSRKIEQTDLSTKSQNKYMVSNKKSKHQNNSRNNLLHQQTSVHSDKSIIHIEHSNIELEKYDKMRKLQHIRNGIV
jgi:hypothetical protein